MALDELKDLLTFERVPSSDELFVHGDAVGFRRLASLLLKLADGAERGEFPHDHLFTEEWGGNELSSVPNEVEGICINHVKIYAWPDSDGSLKYRDVEE